MSYVNLFNPKKPEDQGLVYGDKGYGTDANYYEKRRKEASDILNTEGLKALLGRLDISGVDPEKDKALASIKIVQKLVGMMDDIPRMIVLQSCFKELGMFDELQYLIGSKLFKGEGRSSGQATPLSYRDVERMGSDELRSKVQKLVEDNERLRRERDSRGFGLGSNEEMKKVMLELAKIKYEKNDSVVMSDSYKDLRDIAIKNVSEDDKKAESEKVYDRRKIEKENNRRQYEDEVRRINEKFITRNFSGGRRKTAKRSSRTKKSRKTRKTRKSH